MDFTPEQLTGVIAIGFGLVRIIEVLVVKGFSFITGKKTNLEETTNLLKRATDNHLSHIEEAVTTAVEQHKQQLAQGERMIQQHERQLEKESELVGYLKGKL